MRPTIRVRLTLWYSAVLSLALALSAGAFYAIHARTRLAQVDGDLARAGALLDRLLIAELEEGSPLPLAAAEALEDVTLPGRSLAVFDAAGALVAGRWEGLPAPPAGPGPSAASARTPAGAFRLHRKRHEYHGQAYALGVAESQAALDRELLDLRRALLASVLLSLVLAAGGGWWIARAALAPVASMAEQARRARASTPGFRLVAGHPQDELGALATAFNDLLARLEQALSLQRQFMADASHELRTPVSIARTTLEVTLGRPGRPEAEYVDSLQVVAEQMRRLTCIVEDLFTLARADAAGLPLERAPLYLDELAADCVKESRRLAAPRGIAVDLQGVADLEVQGDERLLRQMLMNLLDNALRHSPPGGSVRVELTAPPGAAEVAVTDSGPGIPEADRERVFERFVRLDPARSGGGAGLGLPIARAIAETHGGSLALARSDASGSTFLLRLPRA